MEMKMSEQKIELTPSEAKALRMEETLKARQEEEKFLAELLDDVIKDSEHVIALKTEMGVTLQDTGTEVRVPAYVASHSLRHISNFVYMKMGSEMPFMENSIDVDGRLMVDETNAAELAQRAPDWSRQPALTAYLLHDPNHKFGAILAVISPAWVDDPNHENWGPDGKALKSAIKYKALDSAGTIGILDLSNADVYALDGQHRVMGIRGLQELKDGKLVLKKKEGTPTNKSIRREEFLAEFKTDPTRLQHILDEKMSIEYIPAVVKGETQKQAKQRVRSVFVAINSYAKKTDKGENILLDEANGFSIIGRHAGLSHPLFKADKETGRVNWKNTSLPKRSPWITTLQALRDMAENYVGNYKPDVMDNWRAKFKGQVPLRPNENELDENQEVFDEFLDHMAELPIFRRVQSVAKNEEIDVLRMFPSEVENGEGHLLLRPIGQTILASAVGTLAEEGMAMDELFAKLQKFDDSHGFEQHLPENIWYGITFNPRGHKMLTSNQGLAADFLKYMVQGADQKERDELLDRVKKLRADDTGKNWLNFDNTNVSLDDLSPGSSLPIPIK
jgi:hypothetical protein